MKRAKVVPSRLADLFRLEEAVARGTSGRVFRATRLADGARAAIKCVDHPSVRDEARLLAQLDLDWGPRVLASGVDSSAVFELGATRGAASRGDARARESRASGVAWVAYTWAEGRALDVCELPSNADERLRLAAAVAHGVGRALEEIHALGVRHGDVKPANVVVREEPHRGRSQDRPEERGASLVDFGFATRGRGLLGASPRYAAPELESGGPALVEADLYALGLVLGEIVDPVAHSLEKLALRERIATFAGASGPEAWARALVSRAPLGRPPAGWVAEQAAVWLGLEGREARAREARVRAVVRSAVAPSFSRVSVVDEREGDEASSRDEAVEREEDAPIGEPVRSWLAEARARVAAASFGTRLTFRTVRPLGTLELRRWLVSLVGPRAASFPVPTVDEATLAKRLLACAERGALAAISWRDLEGDAPFESNDDDSASVSPSASFDVTSAARVLRELAGTDLSDVTSARLETALAAGSCPWPLAVAFAEHLVRRGEIGRAHAALAWVEEARERKEHADSDVDGGERAGVERSSIALAEARLVLAEVARRRGEPQRSEALAKLAEVEPACRARARALLARLAWERGALDEAERLADRPGALAAEVRGLVAYSRGHYDAGLAALAPARLETRDGSAVARLDAVVGMLEHARGDAEASLRAFARALDHATRAGAFVEEATYATGAAAAATDAGYVALGLAYGMRAALLWERLAQPARAARAWLSRAAAYGLFGAVHGAERAAREALALAETSGDSRASAYARWAYAEALGGVDTASIEGLEGVASLDEARRRAADAACRADEALALADPDDPVRVRAAARLLVYATLAPERVRACDERVRYTDLATRWEWWGARAEVLGARARERAADGATDARFEGRRVVTELLALLAEGARVAVGSRGPALAAAAELARELGDGDATRRFEHALGELAERVRRGGDAGLDAGLAGMVVGDTSFADADALASASANAKRHWTRFRESAPQGSALSQAQIAQLESIVRSLGTGEGLRPLLAQVLDALVLWTGVERGLLLVRAPNGRLVPRVARNLAREDLVGEQLALSTTLAQRALETGEAIVAIDALATHGETHASVHALRLRSVLAVPLCARGEVLGVAYLDDRMKKAAFGPDELGWVRLLATQAAMAISDARDKVRLRRALRHEARAAERARQVLGRREVELEAVRATLAATGDAGAAGGAGGAGAGIVGTSAALTATLRVAVRVAGSDVPVLVTGESGTGKELVARTIHARGARRDRAFVSENCASVPESLLESTLFGHVKGAFTGASSTRIGLFDVAHRGTLFLDEIGEMSPAMQAKLLRVLQDGEVRPVGSERTRNVDVRIIGATHRDLEAMVRAGTFREDLYYRLNVVTLKVPALRERSSDIPLLFVHFLEKYGGGRVPQVTRAALDKLQAYAWPGNVRQLENEARRALVLADDRIDVAELSPEITRGACHSEAPATLRGKLDELEAELVRAALDAANGNQTKAALELGLSRFGLQKMLKRLGIR